MHKFIYISVLCLLFFSSAPGQDKRYIYIDTSLIRSEEDYVIPETEDAVVVEAPVEDHTMNETVTLPDAGPDTTLYLNDLSLSADSVWRWRNAKEFAYTKYLDSLLKAQQEKGKKKAKPAGPGLIGRFLSSDFLRVSLWTLAIVFVLFIIYRLFLTEGVFRRETRPVKPEQPEVEEETITSGTDFNALIRQAVQRNNFRLAVRYQYLRSLHKLADKGFIELSPDKTNYRYVREIKDSRLQNDFAAITLNYEYVWYGEFEIENDIYQKMERGFTNFNQKI